MSSDSTSRAAEKAQLLTRCRLTLNAAEQAEPSPIWEQFRAAVEANANRLTALRAMARELAAMAAHLPADARDSLARTLAAQGIDVAAEGRQETAAVAAIRARGRIRSEAEYRRVQAYVDVLAYPEHEAEYLALGALLDAYMVGESAT